MEAQQQTDVSDVTDLNKANIENAVVHTVAGYEWVYGMSGSLVNGRKQIVCTDDNGTVEEIVSGMGHYYCRGVSILLAESLELVGFATDMEAAGKLVQDHYQTRQE